MKLIVITEENRKNGETEIINRLLAAGLRRLHIRKPNLAEDELRQFIIAIKKEYHKYIVLHNHFGLYHELAVGGIHLSSFVRDNADTQMSIQDIPAGDISTSFHSWQEIIENRYQYGYVFISPVFNSISKPGYNANIDLAGAMEVKKRLTAAGQYIPQIIGLGGITNSNISILQHNGFDGAAMLGNIWMAHDPVAELQKAIHAIQRPEDGQYHSED